MSKPAPEKLDICAVAEGEPREDSYSCSSTSEQIYAKHDAILPLQTKIDISKVAPAGTSLKESAR